MNFFNYEIKISKIQKRSVNERLKVCEELIEFLYKAFDNNVEQLNKLTKIIEKLTDGN